MDGWFKGLIAVTCAAVLAAVGWWGWSEWNAAAERESAQAEAEEAQQVAVQARSAAMRADCEARIAAWDAGNRQGLIDEYGRFAEDVVTDCRMMIEFWKSAPR